MKKKISKFKLFRWLCLIGYIGCTGVLIVESAMNGKASSNQSNAVGGTIAGIVNDMQGDQTTAIIPTSLAINNKISQAYVGDTLQLTTTTSPSDATYKEVIYSSTDNEIATVTGDGLITFNKQGTVTINVHNSEYNEVKDSFTCDILNVDAESISSSIHDLDPDDNVYTLYLNKEYHIDTFFTPTNTTFTNLSYVYNSTYLSIDNEGTITPLKYTAGSTITIEVKHNDLISTLNVKIEYEKITKLSSINLSLSSSNISIGQTITPTISFSPTDATFKDYELSTSDSNIAKISGNKIVGVSKGKSIITVSSKTYKDIKHSIEINVTDKPQLSDFTISFTKKLIEGKTTTIKYTKTPSYAENPPSITYTSSDPSVATVSSKGVITAIKEGTTTISVKINNITKSAILTVEKPIADVKLESYTLSLLKNDLMYQETYNLNEVVSVSLWNPSKPNNTSLTYELEDDTFGTVEGNKLTVNKVGKVNLIVTHTQSNIKNKIELNFIGHPFKITNTNNQEVNSLNLNVGNSISLLIDDSLESSNQSYIISSESNNLSITQDGKKFDITVIQPGDYTIEITSIINEEVAETKSINVSSTHIHSSLLKYHLINDNTSQEIVLENDIANVFINSSYSINTSISNDATISKLEFTSSNDDILSVDNNGKINFNSPGTSVVTITETYSNLKKEITFNVSNVIDFQETIYSISGQDCKLISDHSYSIVNGYSGNFEINFSEKATFTKVCYTSSNEEVATIGQDGTITPLKAGKTILKAVIDDGVAKEIVIEIELEIKRQDFISDLRTFLYQVRKGLGHFSAFLVLGIFSSLTWLLFFDKKKLFFSVPTNFASGFLIAALTEFIQTFVPGRYGAMSDVILDFEGFLVSSVTITLVILIITITRYVKNKKKS